MASRRVFGLLIVVMVLGAACSNSSAGVSDPPIASDPSPPPVGPAPSGGDVEVPSELQFETTLLGGGQLSGADLAGDDLAIWFWAPW